jgi:hypothetical protein
VRRRLFDHDRHPADNENYVAERATVHTIALDEHTCPARLDVWGPLVSLRDDTQMFPGDKPAGGWWVTPIHTTLLADGKVLVTGWGRRDRVSCVAGGTRKNGVSFILDPADLTTSSLNITPIDEAPEQPSDVLYCAGFTPMPDGRVLYASGATYEWLRTPQHLEWGLNYARVFDPRTRSFQRVAARMTEGPAGGAGVRWYPATTRLTDGRVLVTGGFTQCCDTKFENLSIEAFDPPSFDAGGSPWPSLVTHAQGAPEIGASIRDYPRVFSARTAARPRRCDHRCRGQGDAVLDGARRPERRAVHRSAERAAARQRGHDRRDGGDDVDRRAPRRRRHAGSRRRAARRPVRRDDRHVAPPRHRDQSLQRVERAPARRRAPSREDHTFAGSSGVE